MKHIGKNWYWYALALLILGVLFKLNSNTFSFLPCNVQYIKNGVIYESQYFVPLNNNQLFDLIGNICVSFAMALFVSQLFVKAIEKGDKERFEGKILNFQKETARDAIMSTFETLVDKDFMRLIKEDVFDQKTLRRNVRWHYDFFNKPEGILLRRTISYKVFNTGKEDVKESVKLLSFQSEHCTTTAISAKYTVDGDDCFKDIKRDNDIKKPIIIKGDIDIPKNKHAEIVLVMEQLFGNGYAYETHFLNKNAIHLELTVNHDQDYDFEINSSVLGSRIESIINEPTKKVYRISGAIYRGQGIEFLYEKKTNKGFDDGC